jgi:hypothetical protein
MPALRLPSSVRKGLDILAQKTTSVSVEASILCPLNPVNARPMFGWFLFNMAHFLAQPEARTLYANAKT